MKCKEEIFLNFFQEKKPSEFTSTLKMLFRLEHTFIFSAIVLLNIELCFCACELAEYEINKECCPMCAPGNYVYRHCTDFVSTVCAPCVDSFISEPNGLLKCLSCAVCDSGQGLRVKKACTKTSDTVCEPMDGFYCTNHDRRSCTHAVEHTKCNPGQYIKQKGTAQKDAECDGCINGTYSDGSLEICKQHTKCEDLGRSKIKPGTPTSDVKCGNKIHVFLIVGIVGIVCISVGALGVCLLYLITYKERRANRNAEKKRTTKMEELLMNGASTIVNT